MYMLIQNNIPGNTNFKKSTSITSDTISLIVTVSVFKRRRMPATQDQGKFEKRHNMLGSY